MNHTPDQSVSTDEEFCLFTPDTPCPELQLSHERNDVDDIAQIVYYKWHRIHSRSSTTYHETRNDLLRVAYTAFINRYRRSCRENILLNNYHDLVGYQDRSESRHEEIKKIILKFLSESRISERKRNIFWLWLFGGYPPAQIATLMKLTEPTIYRYLKSVKKRLRQYFIDYGLTPEDL